MAVHLEFDEVWLRDYEARTGKRAHELCAPGQQAGPEGKKRSKYGNRKTEYAGKRFDSVHEAEVYKVLEIQVRAGQLRGVICQQAFALPGGVKYVADFVTLNADGTYSVMDAKSEATRRDKVYRIKRRQMRECLGIEIIEI